MSAHEEIPGRRSFLGQLAAASAAFGLSGTVAERLAAESVAPPAAQPNPDLAAWFGKITGKHRIVFDAAGVNNGMGVIWPKIYLMTMDGTYPGEAATAVVIARHEGLPLALGDAIWAKYPIGDMFNIKAGDQKLDHNPYATITGLPIPGLGTAELLKGGVLVGACAMAIKVYSGAAAKKMNMDPAAVEKEWTDGVLPGVQVVPSGVMAVGRTQELGCQYCYAG